MLAPGSWEKLSGTMVTVVPVACQLSGLGGGEFPESELSVLSPCEWWTTDGRAGTSAARGKARPSRDKNLTQSCHPQVQRIALHSRALGDDCPWPSVSQVYCSSRLIVPNLVNRCYSGTLFSFFLGIPLSSLWSVSVPESYFFLFVEGEFSHFGGAHSPGTSWEGAILRT